VRFFAPRRCHAGVDYQKLFETARVPIVVLDRDLNVQQLL